MTNDRLNTIKDRLNDYADELEDDDSILMMQSIYVRDVAYLIAEIERLKALESKMGSGWALVEYEELDKKHRELYVRLTGAEKELEQLRKVVGCMGRGWDYWFISDSDAKANNIDIAGMKEGMGK